MPTLASRVPPPHARRVSGQSNDPDADIILLIEP
jgi:hypothetical protein